MNEEDIKTLLQTRRNAPHSWRCSSEYYRITGSYGIFVDDRDRDTFVDKEISRYLRKAVGSTI